jgi:tRNA (guanine37-N1)-methyltransferase
MIFDVVTIFPDFFTSILRHGALRRALESGRVELRIHDLRDFTDGPHRTVDDRPFGGGPGMVFKPEPVFRAVEFIREECGRADVPVILLSPQGRLLGQPAVEELAGLESSAAGGAARIVLICGRYEGVDNRVQEALATDELSIGDYVLSGGELAAAVVMESCTRLLPGVMGNKASREQESFASAAARSGAAASDSPKTEPGPLNSRSVVTDQRTSLGGSTLSGKPGLLDFPQYTRPAEFRGLRVPEVLLSGNHEQIRRWRRRQALQKTWRQRPDLLENCDLSDEDRELLEEAKGAAFDPVTRA